MKNGLDDTQVGHLLCEDAPQELRSRMWMALLDDPGLCGNLLEEKVTCRTMSTKLFTTMQSNEAVF